MNRSRFNKKKKIHYGHFLQSLHKATLGEEDRERKSVLYNIEILLNFLCPSKTSLNNIVCVK